MYEKLISALILCCEEVIGAFLGNQKVYDFLVCIRTTKASAGVRRELTQAKSYHLNSRMLV
jgi:hypothetical protein